MLPYWGGVELFHGLSESAWLSKEADALSSSYIAKKALLPQQIIAFRNNKDVVTRYAQVGIRQTKNLETNQPFPAVRNCTVTSLHELEKSKNGELIPISHTEEISHACISSDVQIYQLDAFSGSPEGNAALQHIFSVWQDGYNPKLSPDLLISTSYDYADLGPKKSFVNFSGYLLGSGAVSTRFVLQDHNAVELVCPGLLPYNADLHPSGNAVQFTSVACKPVRSYPITKLNVAADGIQAAEQRQFAQIATDVAQGKNNIDRIILEADGNEMAEENYIQITVQTDPPRYHEQSEANIVETTCTTVEKVYLSKDAQGNLTPVDRSRVRLKTGCASKTVTPYFRSLSQ